MFNFLATKPFEFSKIFGNVLKNWYYYLALVVAIALIIVFAFKKKQNRNSLSTTQKIVYTAIFSALSCVVNSLTIKASDVWQISFVSTIGFVAGYTLGAGLGFASAFIGDLIGGIITPFGAYNPIIGIGTGLWGFIPGVIFTCFKGNNYVKTIISFAIGFILSSFVVNTFGLSVMYSISFDKLMLTLPVKLAVTAMNAVLCVGLVSILPRVLPKDKFHL